MGLVRLDKKRGWSVATRAISLGRRQIKISLFLPGKVNHIATLNLIGTLDSESIKIQHVALKSRNAAHGMCRLRPSPVSRYFLNPVHPFAFRSLTRKEKYPNTATWAAPAASVFGKDLPRSGKPDRRNEGGTRC